jgi:Amt family ammonium transporter
MGALLLGPRIGKYQNGGVNAIPGHNMSIATLGCLILWIGWFGFNPGSQLAADLAVPQIALVTNLSGAAGGIAATFTAWALSGKPDLSMVINGILAGLVGITAGCGGIGYWGAIIVGLISGIIVVFSVGFFDSIKIDDPVGATSVHLVCGIWGTLAVGLFHQELGLFYGNGITQLIAQIIGIVSVGVFTVVATSIIWIAIKSLIGLRVSSEEELKGLDIGEHGMEAYSGFLKDTSDMGGII